MSSRIRILFAPLLVAACAGAAFLGWQTWQSGRSMNALRDVVQTVDMEALLRGQNDDVNNVDLALRGISLSEGEKGAELWRLKAQWATIQQEAAVVDLNLPHVLYRMGQKAVDSNDPSSYLDVTGKRGQLEEENTRVSLVGDVRAEHDRHILTGPEAFFINQTRILTFPCGADLDGPSLSGSADVLRWDVANNTLDGKGHVVMILSGKEEDRATAPAGSMTVEEVPSPSPSEISSGAAVTALPDSSEKKPSAPEGQKADVNSAATSSAKEQTL